MSNRWTLVLAAVLCAGYGCGRGSQPATDRMAVLPFENLTPDGNLNWMERGAAQVLADEISAAPRTQVTVVLDRNQAAAQGVKRFVSGYYSMVKGKLRLNAWITEGPSGSITRVASAEGSGVIAVADRVARQIEPKAQAFATGNELALRAFVEGRYAEAVSADRNFGPAYLSWLQSAVLRRDRTEAERILATALTPGIRLRDIDRVRLQLEYSTLRSDAAGRARALEKLASLRPTDPAVWRSYADNELAAHRLQQAAALYRKAADLEPDEPALLNTLGYTEALAGNLGAAVKAIEAYRRLRPGDANALDSLGDIYYRFNRMGEAEKYYRESFEKAPEGQGQASLMKAAQARLCTGDVAGADAIFQEFLKARQRAGDPTAGYRQAVWLYLSGRRDAAMGAMEALTRQTGAPQLAAQAKGQLAVWYLERGNRTRAREFAEGAGTGSLGAVARFLTEPPATASEWAVRAERTFPAPAQERLKNFARGYALLLSREFGAAAPLWQQIYRQSSPLNSEDTQVLLAWSLVETKQWDDVEALIQANPLPQAGGPTPFASLAFPRILELRARLYRTQGKNKESAENDRLYRLLSGNKS